MYPILANVILDYFEKGGPVMWPILVALLAALTVVLERMIWWWTLRLRPRRSEHVRQEPFDAIAEGRFDEAVDLTANNTSPFLRTVNEGAPPCP